MSSQTDQLESKNSDRSGILGYLEVFIVATLSVSIAVIFFNVPRWTRAFGEAGFGALLLWALYHKRKPINPIPKSLIIASVLYILSYVINVFMCSDPNWEHVNIRKYIYIIIGGLLFAFPVKNKYRTFMIFVFLTSAAIAGVVGVFQFVRLGLGARSEGFSGNPLHYAGLLGFACCTAVFLVFFRNRHFLKTKSGSYFLSTISIVTLLGIFFSQARGVWIALFCSIAITLLLYNRRLALPFILLVAVTSASLLYFNSDLRFRAISIFTSVYTEDSMGSTGTRIELWKGSLYIAKESPFFGVGTGNFEKHIEKYINEKKINAVITKMHAHNIYFQSLATRGVIGLLTTLVFFAALIHWGKVEMHNQESATGYIIILNTIFVMIGGVTENNIEFTRFLAAFCFALGLFGTAGIVRNPYESAACNSI